MSASPVAGGPVQRVVELCDEALTALVPGPGRDAVAAIRAKLDEPLQVTVAGSVSAGKSTLVNALLGQKIAAVDAGECTRVVTWFRYDHHERADVRLSTGESYSVPLENGALPSSLGAPLEQVQRLDVYLSNAGLRDLSIIDTPGLNTVTAENEDATASFLGVGDNKEATDSSVAVSQADALLFLMPHNLRSADAAILEGFRSLYEGTGLSAVNAVGILSKVDQLSRTGDPLEVAAPIAARVAGELRGLVSEVVPVVGLVAETANAAAFTEDDARAIAVLAAVDDELDREDMLLTPADFLRFDGVDLDVETRTRLLGKLDLYGIKLAIGALDAGGRGASAIVAALDAGSGFAPLRAIVFERFGRSADLLKANGAIAELRRASYLRTDPDNGRVLRSLRAPLERIELDPTLHQLRVLDVMRATAAGELNLPDELLRDVEALAAGRDPLERLGVSTRAHAPQLALEGASRWGTWIQDPRRAPSDARYGNIVKEAYEVLYTQVQEST